MKFIEQLEGARIYLIVTLIILILIIIITGRILNEINLSKDKSDSNIQSAHKWAAWSVGLSSTFAVLTLVFVGLSFIPKKVD